MGNGYIEIRSHPGHPLAAVDTPKAPDPYQKYSPNPPKIQPLNIFESPKLRWDSDDHSMMTPGYP